MPQPPVVLGLDFGGTKIAMAVSEPAGQRLASATVSSDAGGGAAATFERGVGAARELLAHAAAGRELAAVGVSTFGIPYDDRVELAPAIRGWDGLALGDRLRDAFPGAGIAMATDAKAAALAEARWGALAGSDPAVYLNLGTGLSAAIVIGGQVVAGANGAAGEIGYNLRAISDVGAGLDARIPLEGMISGQALADRAARQPASRPAASQPGTGQPGTGHPDGNRPLTAADVFAVDGHDPALAGLVTEFVTELSFHLVNLAILLNPARIAAGGGLVRSWHRIGPGLQHALAQAVPYPPELVTARYQLDAPLVGAIALATEVAQARLAGPGAAANGSSSPISPHQTAPGTAPGLRTITEGPLL
ncbi:MAG TPA: ROK family protein [Streptosporangiaceae bacterium]|nr:ROK family protein [Streptosporangiaceae bacterium]